MIKQVLVTGATGLVGTHLIAELLERATTDGNMTEYGVTAVAHSPKSWTKLDWLLEKRDLSDRSYRREVAELEYIDDCRRLIQESRPHIIFHCAAQVSLGNISEGEELVTRNVEITHYLLTAALELPKEEQPLFVHVSSIAALGRTANKSGLIDESAMLENIADASAYARSKLLSEREVWRAAVHGLRVAMVNPAVVIGAMSPESNFWLNGLFRVAQRNIFWIDGEVAFVSARDVARAMILICEEPKAWGERYILASENIPYRTLLTHIAQLVGKRPPWLKIPHWIVRIVEQFVPALSSVISDHRPLDGSKITRTIPLQYSILSDTLTEIACNLKKI